MRRNSETAAAQSQWCRRSMGVPMGWNQLSLPRIERISADALEHPITDAGRGRCYSLEAQRPSSACTAQGRVGARPAAPFRLLLGSGARCAALPGWGMKPRRGDRDFIARAHADHVAARLGAESICLSQVPVTVRHRGSEINSCGECLLRRSGDAVPLRRASPLAPHPRKARPTATENEYRLKSHPYCAITKDATGTLELALFGPFTRTASSAPECGDRISEAHSRPHSQTAPGPCSS